MKKLGPGCNEEGWKCEAKCVGSTRNGGVVGCGAPLEITRADLYFVLEHDISGAKCKVRFLCPCGVESDMLDARLFKDLPKKIDWIAKQKIADQ
ncbi:MAG: hypothetical protein WCV84_00240 [Patescibacteria group bacterium]